jgi:CDP-glucose 4,6-dehydratase
MEDMGLINPLFWRGKRVFLTGHTGFKGSWLSVWLSTLGADVLGYSLDPPTEPSLFVRARIDSIVKDIRGDIRNLDSLSSTLNDYSPDIVIHMAAQPIVKAAYRDPLTTYSTNVIGTANLLEAVRRCSSTHVVLNITTDKVYQNKEWCWGYRESEAFGGYDPYSASKACSELVTASYRESFFNLAEYGITHNVAMASARAGNVIGGGDWASDRIIPDLIRAFSTGEKVRIRNPNSIRPWQHVLEPLGAYLCLCEKLFSDPKEYSEGWNIGPSEVDAHPVRWIVERMMSLWPGAPGYEIDEGDHPHEANYLKLDISKARSRLGWQPRWALEKALAMIIDWHFRTESGEPSIEVCRDQIRQYLDEPAV